MLDKDAPPESSITTVFPGDLAQLDESVKRPTPRKRRATEVPYIQRTASDQHEDRMPRLKRLARKPTPDNGQQVSCISDNNPSSKATRALAGLRWQCSNKASSTEVAVPMSVASGGLGSTSTVLAPVPTYAPNVMLNYPLNGAEVLSSCTPDCTPNYSDQYPWEPLAALGFPSPDLYSVSGGTPLMQWSNPREALVHSVSKEERTEYARQQSCGSRSLECPWGSLLEQIVSVELVISQLSRNAKQSPQQQASPQGFEVLLEDFVELKQRYLHLRKFVQDSKKFCGRAQCLGSPAVNSNEVRQSH